MICQVCGGDFEGREGAKCCSSTCRSKLSRGISVAQPPDDPLSVAKGSMDKISVATDKIGEISIEEPCKTGVASMDGRVDLEKDLGLNLKKDLGITSWTADGIFLCNDITIDQVQNIARLVHAKRGRVYPKFLECR